MVISSTVNYMVWNKGLTKETDERIRKYGEKNRGENNPMWKGGKPKCLICKKTLTRKEYRYCKTHAPRRKLSEETKKKISKSHMGLHKGDRNPRWKGGITPENLKIRHSIEYNLWRESVFARDNWTCQKTGIKGGKLVSHHILNFSKYPELRFAIDNGITLSRESHIKFHKLYGKKNNTREQLIEFLCL